MMLKLNDGRNELWQWDTGRTLAVDADCSQVHFSNKVFGRSIDVDVASGTAIIPDILLQTDKDLNVWAFVGTAENGYTKISKTFKVNRRNKPADYVFTPVEQTTIDEIAEIAQSVRDDADAGRFDGAQGPAGESGGYYTPAVTQPNANTMRLSFSPSKEGMPDVAETDITLPSVGGGGGSGVSGEDGGYYTPSVTQPTENTMQVSFTPSKATMPAVSGNEITLPAGPAGSKGEKGDKGDKGADGKSAYQYAMDGGYTGTETEFSAKMAQEIPKTLPNPNALTFSGAVTGSYDGSAPLEVAIPSGGGGGTGGGDDVFELIGEATSSGVSDVVGLTIPFDGSLYKIIIAYAYNLPAGNKKRIIIRNTKNWYDGSPLGWNNVADAYLPSVTKMNDTWSFFGAAIDVGGKLFTLGAAEANANGGHGFFRFWPQNGALPTLSLSDSKFISLDCNSNSEILPDGCSLIVWGVRK